MSIVCLTKYGNFNDNNTATPVHEKFKNDDYGAEFGAMSVSECVYRHRHISIKDQRFASIALEEAENLHFLCNTDVLLF